MLTITFLQWSDTMSRQYVICTATVKFLNAGYGSQCATAGPSIDIRIRLSNVFVFRRFLLAVFILFIVENNLSTCVLDAGKTAMRAKMLEIIGYATAIVSLFSGECMT